MSRCGREESRFGTENLGCVCNSCKIHSLYFVSHFIFSYFRVLWIEESGFVNSGRNVFSLFLLCTRRCWPVRGGSVESVRARAGAGGPGWLGPASQLSNPISDLVRNSATWRATNMHCSSRFCVIAYRYVLLEPPQRGRGWRTVHRHFIENRLSTNARLKLKNARSPQHT